MSIDCLYRTYHALNKKHFENYLGNLSLDRLVSCIHTLHIIRKKWVRMNTVKRIFV